MFSFGGWSPLAIGMGIRGHIIESDLPSACQEKTSELRNFVNEILGAGLGTGSCMLLGLMLLWFIRCRGKRILLLYSQETVRRITTGPPAEVLPGQECTICLEAETEGDAGDTVRAAWRRLTCGHIFHEACARRWMAQETSCPLCRQAIEDISQCTRLRPGRSRDFHQDQDQDVDLEQGQVGDCGPSSVPEAREGDARKCSSMSANITEPTIGASAIKTTSQMDV